MSLQFVLGKSGSGKTHMLYEELIRQSIAHPEHQYILLVPEQFTLQTQKDLVILHPGHGIMNIDILSFERLAYRVFDELGVNPGVILDDLGKSMLLKKVAATHMKELSVYGRHVGRIGFTEQMKSTLSEFYQYRIHPEQLDQLVETAKENPLLACKLKDIAMVYRAFEEAMEQGSITAEELLEVLSRNLSRSKLIRTSTIVMDGYTGFTPVQYEVIRGLLQCAPKVVVTATIDPKEEPYRQRGSHDLFSMSRTTISRLQQLAIETCTARDEDVLLDGVPVYRFRGNPKLAHLEENLFRYPAKTYRENRPVQCGHESEVDRKMEKKNDALTFYAATDRRGEMNYVCREILRLVRDEHYRYREIAVLTKDMAGFVTEAESAFETAGIPYFMDNKRSMLFNPLVEWIRSCLEVIRQDFSYESVFRYAKCGFSSLKEEDLFALENYVIALGIRGASKWNQTWDRTYRGEELINLERINAAREELIAPLMKLRPILRDKEISCEEKIGALMEWIEETGAYKTLSLMGSRMEVEGVFRLSKECAQIPEKITELFERIKVLMGQEKLTLDELSEVLDTGFEEIRIGTIPPCIDRVTMGDLERTRLTHVRAVFLVGFNEGIIPAVGSHGGLLTENDRERLKELGAELAPTAKEQGFIEKFYLYLALTKASERLYLCWSETGDDGKAVRPSAYLGTLQRLFPEQPICREGKAIEAGEPECWESVVNRESGMKLIASGLCVSREQEVSDAWKEVYGYFWSQEKERTEIRRMLDATFGGFKQEQIRKAVSRRLYGQQIYGSVSRLEAQAACAYRQFLTYGLRLSKRQEYEFAAVDMGNLFHQSLEICFARLREKGLSVGEISEEDRKKLVSSCVQEVAATYGNTILGSSARNQYLTARIERITDRTLWAVGEQTRRGEMVPTEFELSFSGHENEDMRLKLDDEVTMNLRGRIDRVDVYEDDASVYVRILDYKSGMENFDLNRIYHGLQLQLVVYLGAVLAREKKLHPDKAIEPAGVFYFHINDPVIDSDQMIGREAADRQILEKLKLDGLVSADEKAIRLQDREFTGKSAVIPVTEKDGVIQLEKSRAAGRQQFERLSEHVRDKMAEFGKGIVDGNIPVNPYRLKGRSACDYCDFSSVCGFDTRLPGCHYRQLKVMDDKTVWEKMTGSEAAENEGKGNGGEADGDQLDN